MDPDVPQVKPAWLTTEFWITVIPTIVVLIKFATGKDIKGVDITGLATLAVGISTAAYAISRAIQKRAVIQARASLTAQKASIAFESQHNQLARAHETAMQAARYAPQVGAKELDELAGRLATLEDVVMRRRTQPRKVAKAPAKKATARR